MTGRPVHPVADLFPMLGTDELAELAEDIKQRGLLHPVVLDVEGRVLDGRNRLAACELAGVAPTFVTYGGADADGYALAVNGQRREMTKRQKAIVAARFSKLEGRGDQRKAARALGIPESSVSEAKVVAEHKDLAALVLAGTRPFAAALAEARERDRREAEEVAAKTRLAGAAPDLLSLVDEERMSLADAVAALYGREEKARKDELQREQERQESLERDRDRIRMVITGWSTVRDIVLPDPGGPQATEILDGLGESDRLAFQRILDDLTEPAQ